MEILKHTAQVCFVLISLLDLVFIWYDLPYRAYSKSLIIPILGLYYFSAVSRYNLLFILALFFAWLGDVFLLFESSNSFLFGLGSFMIMQGLYTIVFFKELEYSQKLSNSIILILGIFCVLFVLNLLPKAENFEIPIVIYSLAISAMAYSAILRNRNFKGYKLIVLGVILFIASDSMLALNKFGGGFWNAGLLVMLSYILAQYFIVEGYIRHSNNPTYKD